MPDDGGVSEKLAAAKSVLAGARKFQASTGGPMYSAVRAARSSKPAPQSSGDSLGAELKAKADNVGNYVKGTSDK
jgi:hypothetical protein